MTSHSFDAIVLGAGFGGSLLATILSRRGLRVAMIDRQSHPRFAIGESSTPAADLILHDLACRDELPELLPLPRFGSWQQSHPELLCGCKRGFSYLWHGSGNQFRASPDRSCELLVTANDSRILADTHWYRPEVDQFFSEVASQRGVQTYLGVESLQLAHPQLNRWDVSFADASGTKTISAPFVIDATGPSGVVLKTLGIRSSADSLLTRSSALYGHWENLSSLETALVAHGINPAEYPYPIEQSVIHHLFTDGWFWQIPFENGRTSFGFVFDGKKLSERSQTPAAQWYALVDRSPLMKELFREAFVPGFPGKLFRTERLQRIADLCAGPDWAVLPHTAGFIDPLHSTGIAHTLAGVERLADALSETSARTESLENYNCITQAEHRLIDKLVAGCYQSLENFTRFRDWSMIYFAAATSYERNRLSGKGAAAFLLADDCEFNKTVDSLWNKLKAGDSEDFGSGIRDAIAPWNRVGLFAPAQPNLYFKTAAEKR